MIIYKATNKVNGKFYIGKTVNKLKYRIRQHELSSIRQEKTYFYNAIRKYGINNFGWIIVCECDDLNVLNKKEVFYIESLNARDRNIGYNLAIGGFGGAIKGRKLSQETKDKIRKTAGKAWRGKKQPRDMVDKRAKKLKGRTSPMKGRNQSEKSKELISLNNAKYWSGKHLNEETKNKLREKRKSQDMAYRCKSYLVISPSNKEYRVENGLETFCKSFNLQRSKLVLVAQNKRKHHKQWKCSYL